VPIQPRPLAVLAYLASRPGVVVSRDELIARLWADTFVTKAVLKVAVRAIREAIGDDAESPRYIETVGREGYRFIGAGDAPAATAQQRSAMVGRESDLARLHAGLAQAHAGVRALLFVSGEAGSGKTTLLDRFVDDVARASDVRVVRGQCLEQYGEGEPYLPVLEALGALARDDDAAFGETVARHAPTWVSHLAAIDAPVASADAPLAATSARMLREMADALDVFTRERTLVLVLEDLQWSDRSSVDLIGCIARRRQSARLLVVGSMRPGDMKAHDHPLLAVQHELQVKGLCQEIALELLSPDEVAAYVATRFDGVPPASQRQLALRIHERSEGNGLFMVNMANDLVATGLLARRDGRWHVDGSIQTAADRIPAGLQEMLGRRMHDLAPFTRKVLDAASVAGEEFTVAAVAATMQADEARIEDACEQLASQGSLLVDAGVAEWPDGSVSGRYGFRHALYRRVLYEGIAEARRARMHRAIGRRIEVGFGERAAERAAELAMHYTRGRSHPRALTFHELAAAAALDRHAAHEATAHWTAALDALARTPDRPGRARRELSLVVARATLLMATQGYAAPATEQAFARARALCEASPASPALYPVLRGLLSYHQVRAELAVAQELGEQLLHHAAEVPDDRVLRVQAHYGVGTNLFHMGRLEDACEHLRKALAAYDPATHREHIVVYGGYDPGVACSLWLSWTRTLQGHVDEAAALMHDGLALAQRHGHAFSLAWVHQAVSVSQQLFGDWPASAAAATEALRLADEHGFPHVLGMATVNRGWALVMQGDMATGVPLVREGVAMVDETGAGLVRPSYLAMLGGTSLIEGDMAGCFARIDEGLAEIERSGERLFEAWLLVEKGRLLATGDDQDAAVACMRRSLDVARGQGARLLELRAATTLARWCHEHGRTDEARAELAASWRWFAEHGSNAPDVVAARLMIDELSGS
jgi:predicted ATPase